MEKNETQITTALKVAQIESSLGESRANPNSTARGVYQYLEGSWKEKHTGDRENDDDAIRAFYKDMQTFDKWYADHKEGQKDMGSYQKRPSDMQVPSDISREEYIYIKHHDGRSSNGDSFQRDDNMDKGINIFDKRVQGTSGTNDVINEVLKTQKLPGDTAEEKKPEPAKPSSQPQNTSTKSDTPQIQTPAAQNILPQKKEVTIKDFLKEATDEKDAPQITAHTPFLNVHIAKALCP